MVKSISKFHNAFVYHATKTKSLIKIFIIASVILKASVSYALDMDYYTWNGFDIEVEAWRILTLIFADNGYKTLFPPD